MAWSMFEDGSRLCSACSRARKGVGFRHSLLPRSGGCDGCDRENLYKVVRFFFSGRRVTVYTHVSLAEAQAHCQDPETSSSTCCSTAGKARTKRSGQWFDTYTVHK